VRYVDYGNCELRELDCLMKLGSEFKLIPFQAVRCSIATEDYTTFTDKVKKIILAWLDLSCLILILTWY